MLVIIVYVVNLGNNVLFLYLDWILIGVSFWNVLFSDDVVIVVGFFGNGSIGCYDVNMKFFIVIVYFVLDGGVGNFIYGYVFGNIGICVMFNDVDMFGVLVIVNKMLGSFVGVMEGLM